MNKNFLTEKQINLIHAFVSSFVEGIQAFLSTFS